MIQKVLKLSILFLTVFSFNLVAKDVSAYFVGKYQDEASLTKTLSEGGFQVLGSYKLDRKGKLTTLVFTSSELQNLSSKKDRGFFAIGRAILNSKTEEIRISNPCYFGRAFLGDDFSHESVKKVSQNLKTILPDLTESSDILEDGDLEDYNFMMGMPTYEDMVEVGSGKDLLAKIKDPIFSLTLSNGSSLVGVDLGRKTKKFPKKIGFQNGLLLPYSVLIEDGKAKILDPKYYIAVSYPNLSMSKFMKISSIPDAIIKEITREFQ